MKNQYEQFDELMDRLYQFSIEKKLARMGIRYMYSPEHWAREYASLVFDPGRQVGKTTWIIKNADYFDVIITHSHESKKLLQSKGAKGRIFVGTPTLDEVGGNLYKTVYVDEPTFSIDSMDEFWNTMAPRAGHFVLLGDNSPKPVLVIADTLEEEKEMKETLQLALKIADLSARSWIESCCVRDDSTPESRWFLNQYDWFCEEEIRESLDYIMRRLMDGTPELPYNVTIKDNCISFI